MASAIMNVFKELTNLDIDIDNRIYAQDPGLYTCTCRVSNASLRPREYSIHVLMISNLHKHEQGNPISKLHMPISHVIFNLQATKLFIVTPATKGWVVTTPPGFRARFKILYRVIQLLIQHCLLHKMVYLNIIYVIATRSYEFFYYRHFSVINKLLRYSTVTTCVLAK